MKAIKGKNKKRPTWAQKQRRGLLAKVHIAKKELAIPDEDYRDILMRDFGVESAADLAIGELSELVNYFESKGWQPNRRSSPIRSGSSTINNRQSQSQCESLKERVGQEVLHTDFNEKRLRGLVKKICGVDDLRFCRDVVRLKRLLAVLISILDKEAVYD